MAKRRKPETLLQPLLIVDDRIHPDEVWIPVAQLPDNNYYGGSERMLVCQFTPGDQRPTLMTGSYDFERGQWRSPMGEIESVTHWQPLPAFPNEYR